MILVFGGTTEGRVAADTLDEAGKPFYYSTKGSIQEVKCKNIVRLTGAMTAEEIETFCSENNIKLIIDAAHPFAQMLHSNIEEASTRTNTPVIRLERTYPHLDNDIIVCEDYQDAILKLTQHKVKKLLALTGTNTIAKLKGYWENNYCIFRILKREESLSIAQSEGFPQECIRYYEGSDAEEEIIDEVCPDAVITKESGTSGGFEEKIAAARKKGIKVFVVRRPKLSEKFIQATGKHSLRRTIERLLPDYYELKTGVTTGSCATAAVKAAMMTLFHNEQIDKAYINLPNGEQIDIDIERVEKIDDRTAIASVIKQSGDDPDVTNGYEIVAQVCLTDTADIRFLQGKGVGTITLPGLGLPIGSPAINKTPRNTIEQEIRSLYAGGVDVTISVTGGEEIAKRTFNPKLGIHGGISIIGTSGIIQPFSSEAFVNAIEREIEVAKAVGTTHIIINSGAKSEKHIKALYPHLPTQAFIHYGNYIGQTLSLAEKHKISNITMGIMIGKAVKLAEGHLDTHSKKVLMNKDFLKAIATEAGCTESFAHHIDNISMAREIWTASEPSDIRRFADNMLKKCLATCNTTLKNAKLTIMLICEDGSVFTRIG